MLLCVLSGAPEARGQAAFTINGRLKIEGGDLSNSRVVIYKNGEKERVITTGLNKLGMDLELNASYVISFEKDGFVSKKLSFNTRVPADAAATTFTPFDFAVSLFKQYDDLNMVVFNQPVGIIRYEPSLGDFDYDTDYTRSIQAQLQQAIADVEQKQKEEAKNSGAEAKRKAAEDKAQAKAQADAEKQAALDAKAKADAEARETAAQALAQKKAEEEAARQQELKKAEEAARLEQEKKAAETTAAAEKTEKPAEPVAPAPPRSVQPKPAPKPAPPILPPPPPAPPRAQVQPAPVRTEVRRAPPSTVQATSAPAIAGEENRRGADAVVHVEQTPVRKAGEHSHAENRPVVEEEEIWTDRKQEVIEEPNKVTTVIKVTTAGITTEYRRVFHKWGGTFHFKDGVACTQMVYDREALGEQLVGATPRSKKD